MYTVVISTSALNSYGSRVLTSGIDTQQYQRNPVLLWMHRRGQREDAPIGRVEAIHIDGDRLIGTLVFDERDEWARKIRDKWAGGFLRMVSAGLSILETSDAPEHLLPGQRRSTITRSKLEEVSVVDIGANDEALALYAPDGERLCLSHGDSSPALPLLAAPFNHQAQMNEQINLALGLPKEATEAQALEAIARLKQSQADAEQLRLALINDQVNEALRLGKITQEQKDTYQQIGLTLGTEHLRIALSSLAEPARPSSFVAGASPTPQATFARLSDIPLESLESFKQEQPQEYARLYREFYGCSPR